MTRSSCFTWLGIHLRSYQVNFVFGDEDDDDIKPNNQYFELDEVSAGVSPLLWDWARHYLLVLYEKQYD